MTRDLDLTADNASVILRRDGQAQIRYLSHVDVVALRADGWQVEIVRDGGALAKQAILDGIRRCMGES